MSAGGISRLRSLRASFSHVAPFVSKVARSNVSRCSAAAGVLPRWQATQKRSRVARWVAAPDVEAEFCAEEFGAGEFCADSVIAEQKTAPASAINARGRVRISRSLPRVTRSHTKSEAYTQYGSCSNRFFAVFALSSA